MKKLFAILLSSVLVLCLVTPNIPVEAASSKTKKKAIRAYKEWLDGADCTGVCVYDINKDGIKEMLITFDGYGKNVSEMLVYTYKNGKVVSCNKDYMPDYSMFGFTVNTKTKRVYGSRGGGGSIEKWYYTLNKKKKIKKVYLQAIESGYNYRTGKMKYNYYYNGKKITKKKYTSLLKTWNKNSKPLKFHKMTVKNIKKYIK